MGLSDRLTGYAVRSAHVLLVEVPGHWTTRVAVEQALAERGWRSAWSPAEADVLAVCGHPGPELAEVVERLWEQLPGPRVRVDVASPAEAEALLDRAAEDLADSPRHRDDARHRAHQPAPAEDGDDDEHGGHEEMEHGDHGGHEEMDHGHMDMAPSGIPLAEGGDDRDGLEMDLLNVRLGPVLPHWPAGLVLRCTLQGDLVTQAEVHVADAEHHPVPGEGNPPAPSPEGGVSAASYRLDNLSHLLALAGWQDPATRARRLRDAVLAGAATQDPSPVLTAFDSLDRTVRRSRMLRWSLRGLRRLTEEDLAALGLSAGLAGDCHDRLLAMLDRTREALAAPGAGHHRGRPGQAAPVAALPHLVAGVDLAAARLVVAGVDLDPLAAAAEEVSGA